MTKKIKKQCGKQRGGKVSIVLPLINSNAAGIDVGASEHYVAVPPDRDGQPVRRFGAFTEDLHALAQWLLQCGVKTVAMESTGVYWIPLYQILESYELTVKLVNARHVKHVPGRKSDVQDCQWLQQLESFGLLSGSFRPEAKICVLRSYMRQREMLIRSASRHVQQMQKALTEMNIKLHQVISDLTGVTGLTIIRAILAGERDRLKLAAMKDHRIKSNEATIAKALEGDYRPEHLFALRQALELYDYYQQKVVECDGEILKEMQTLETRAAGAPPPPPKGKGKSGARHNRLSFDGRAELYRILGVDLTRMMGSTKVPCNLFSPSWASTCVRSGPPKRSSLRGWVFVLIMKSAAVKYSAAARARLLIVLLTLCGCVPRVCSTARALSVLTPAGCAPNVTRRSLLPPPPTNWHD